MAEFEKLNVNSRSCVCWAALSKGIREISGVDVRVGSEEVFSPIGRSPSGVFEAHPGTPVPFVS